MTVLAADFPLAANHFSGGKNVVPGRSADDLASVLNFLQANGVIASDKVVHAAIAVADAPGGATTAALTLALTQVDGSSALTGARQVMIATGAAQYVPRQAVNGNVTFGTATAGSIIASGSGWALVLTDATGAFACTCTNAADEAIYFWAETPNKVSTTAAGAVVAGSNSDLATWAA